MMYDDPNELGGKATVQPNRAATISQLIWLGKNQRVLGDEWVAMHARTKVRVVGIHGASQTQFTSGLRTCTTLHRAVAQLDDAEC